MAKHATPLLDQLESGPWPSFVSDIKQAASAVTEHPHDAALMQEGLLFFARKLKAPQQAS